MTHLMTPVEAAEYLGLKPQTIAVWRMRGDGPEYVRLGNRIKYTTDALDAWITAHTVHTTNK